MGKTKLCLFYIDFIVDLVTELIKKSLMLKFFKKVTFNFKMMIKYLPVLLLVILSCNGERIIYNVQCLT